MKRLSIGRLKISAGDGVFPDHVDDHAGVVLVIWRLVLGVGGCIWRTPMGNPWVDLYLGWWAVEIYWDVDRSWEE